MFVIESLNIWYPILVISRFKWLIYVRKNQIIDIG